MILGTGVDIIEVDRVGKSLEKFGDRFLKRILHPEETHYCFSNKFPVPHVAVRFAAKEAISKAFGTGIGRHLGWLDIEIVREENGRPLAVLHGNGVKLLKEQGGSHVHVSLSHTDNYAAALAVLEGYHR